MVITGGGSANRMMTLANHVFLSDNAYARRAEKAMGWLTSVKGVV